MQFMENMENKLTEATIDEIWDHDSPLGECLHRLQRVSWGRPLDAAHAYVRCVVAPSLLKSPAATNQMVKELGGAVETLGKDSAAAAAWAVERLENEVINPESKLRAEILPQVKDAFWRTGGVLGCTVRSAPPTLFLPALPAPAAAALLEWLYTDQLPYGLPLSHEAFARARFLPAPHTPHIIRAPLTPSHTPPPQYSQTPHQWGEYKGWYRWTGKLMKQEDLAVAGAIGAILGLTTAKSVTIAGLIKSATAAVGATAAPVIPFGGIFLLAIPLVQCSYRAVTAVPGAESPEARYARREKRKKELQ